MPATVLDQRLRRASVRLQSRVAPRLGTRAMPGADQGEVWRLPGAAGVAVSGGAGLAGDGFKLTAGTVANRPDQTRFKLATYPVRVRKSQAGQGNRIGSESDFGGQLASVAPWTILFNWADNPDVRGDDQIVIAEWVWQAVTAYAVGDKAQPTSNVAHRRYVCIKAGTSGATQPTWPTTARNRAVEWAASTPYVVGLLVAPTTVAYPYLRCTVAGTSGTTEPTWPTTPAATVVDGGATWQLVDAVADGSAVWQEAGTLRVFEVRDPGGQSTFEASRWVGAEEILV